VVSLFLAGDVMTGRGIDRVLPHPGDPRLYESCAKSAEMYVALAECANGPVGRPLSFEAVWGEALGELGRRRPDARIVNLETAVTESARPAPKGINYKMSPANVGVLAAAGIDCCALANNHVLDWGEPGLLETLATLERAGVRWAGAGRDLEAAAAPAVLPLGGRARLLVYGIAASTSGVPRRWAAAKDRPGVNLVPDLSQGCAETLADKTCRARQPGDIVVVSIHWGGNWGYEVPEEQVEFAHRLVDRGAADVVHGHSSHHVKAVEVYRGRPILYGCGDFIDDYEGIRGYEEFRADLVLMYFPTIDAADGRLAGLDMVPMQIHNMRLRRPSSADAAWLAETLNREGGRFGTRVSIGPDQALTLAMDRAEGSDPSRSVRS
jgi:poly-gamma-glutamate synthesis protein (capsule biosynthesis protein)